jgi:hypothetical protein
MPNSTFDRTAGSHALAAAGLTFPASVLARADRVIE